MRKGSETHSPDDNEQPLGEAHHDSGKHHGKKGKHHKNRATSGSRASRDDDGEEEKSALQSAPDDTEKHVQGDTAKHAKGDGAKHSKDAKHAKNAAQTKDQKAADAGSGMVIDPGRQKLIDQAMKVVKGQAAKKLDTPKLIEFLEGKGLQQDEVFYVLQQTGRF